jgi:hypothetical protein
LKEYFPLFVKGEDDSGTGSVPFSGQRVLVEGVYYCCCGIPPI